MPLCPPNNSTFTCIQHYTTIAPPLFSVQYWFYALIVLGGVTALIVGIASQNRALDVTTLIYLLFVGLMIGSFIDLAMNIVSFVFPLFIMIGFAVYIWRTRA